MNKKEEKTLKNEKIRGRIMGFFFGEPAVQQTKTFTIKCLSCEEEINVFDISVNHIARDGYNFIEDINAFCEKHVNHRIIILKLGD